MTRLPRFSILMVTYNSEKFVRDAILSVLNSSFTDFELIISDDASTDNTDNLIKQFSDSRILYFRQTGNLGEYANRNFCIDKATGEYCIFIDGDDLIYPHCLHVLNQYVAMVPDCGQYLMRWYKKNIFYPTVIGPKTFLKAVVFDYGLNHIAFANTLFNTEVLKNESPLPINLKSGDDFIRLKIGLKFNTALITDGLTWWRETPGQASTRQLNKIDELIRETNVIRDFFESNYILFSEDEIIQARRNFEIKVTRIVVKLLKSFKIIMAIEMLRYYNISLLKIFFVKRKVYSIDIFTDCNAVSPANYKSKNIY